MKKTNFRAFRKGLYSKSVKFTATVFLMLSGFSAIAQNEKITEEVKSTNIYHIGNDKENLFFRVIHKNEEGNKFSVVVRDENGSALFQNVYTDKDFDKKFMLPRTSAKVTFIIRDLLEDKSQHFTINTNVRVVEEIIISKI